VLHDGREVVLKIQYPEIARLIRVDLATVRWLAKRIPIPESFVDASELMDELTHSLALELDFEHEAEATERIRKAFAGDDRVRVPHVYPEYTSGKLIVQEYLAGLPVTDLEGLREHGVDLPALAERVASVFTAMIFGQGLFHADPHPGNLLVLPGGVLGLVDFGLAAELPENFGPSMATMITKTWAGDSDAALEAARDLGFNIDELNPALLSEIVARTMSGRSPGSSPRQTRGRSPERRRHGRAERERLNRLAEGGEKLVIPPYFALVGRTVMLLGGLFHSLAPDEKLMERMLRQALIQYAAGSRT
jgi:predicted unusual protein kinase regulating ubiquinone biosynthesis (AarF/ABC1/UbiB family)